MARHNYVFLYGRVTKNPKIITDQEGNYLRGQCMLTTIRGERSLEDGSLSNIQYDCPVILSKNRNLIHEMAGWHENDMIETKGTISTKNITRTTICKHCGYQNSRPGVLIYITPIFLSVVERNQSKEQCFELLKSKSEISNMCIIAGNLCNNPQFFRHTNGLCQTQYQIALNRKFRVKEDPPEIKTDFPWVKSQGDMAENDAKFLMQGSSVLIDGMIQTRRFTQKTVCDQCSQEYEWTDEAMEVIPYCTEYLLNCRTAEEIEEMDKKSADEIFAKLFGS